MDWSKAKTILIVAFIITNILLGFVVFSMEKQEQPTIKQSFIEDVTKILEKKNIFIDSEIPKEMPKLNALTVEYEILDCDKVNRDFFNGLGSIDRSENDLVEIIKDDEKITISNKRTLKYENNNARLRYEDLDKDMAEAIAMEFLMDKGIEILDMKLSYVKEDEDRYILDFSKIYNDRYLEIAYTTIQVDNTGVKGLERLWLNTLNEGETPMYISTAPKSILELLSMEEVYGKTIVDISLIV